MPPAPPDPAAAERSFAEFLERLENGEPCDFDAFCSERAEQADSLRRIHTRWLAMTAAFERIASEPRDATPSATPQPSSLDPLITSLGTDSGRLARYALGDEIARGGMGRIVRAFDQELRREVAVKLQRGDLTDLRRRRRFLEEAQIAAQLDHPGIVPIHELGVDPAGRPFFTMQLVRGRDLGQILELSAEGDPEWSRTRVLNVLLRVCEAMAFAHQRGVVHRDLKPQNVMVGQFGETYVMDWGLARVRDANSAEQRPVDTVRGDITHADDDSALLTRDGDVVGTPAYMAPEQAAGDVGAEPAVDVHAVGAMLYHLLAGHAPHTTASSTADEVLQRVRAGPPPPLPDTAPAELRAICEHAMARAPQQRYASMHALADDLRAFLEVRTVRAYATGRFAELRKWIARNRGLTIAAVTIVMSLLVSSIVITNLWVEATSVGDQLRTELTRSTFRSARQSLQFENSREAGDALWRMHLAGTMPRASQWALLELAERDPYLVTLPLTDDLRPVAFCPPLAAILLGGADGCLQVRDEATLQLQRTIGSPGPAIMSLAALPGSTLVVTGSAAGTVRVLDLAEDRVLREVAAHRGSVRGIVAGKAGAFATAGADGIVSWWRDASAEPRRLLALEAGITSLAMRPQFDGLAAGCEDGRIRAQAIDGSWKLGYGIGARVTALAFGSDKDELWAGGNDHELRRFDFVDSARNLTQPTRNGTPRQMAHRRDGTLLVGGWWRTDRVGADGSPGPAAALRGVSRWALDDDRDRLVTSSASGGLGLIDLSRGDRRRVAGGGTLALSSDGRRMATLVDGRVVVQDVDSLATLLQLPPEVQGRLCLNDDGGLLSVTGGSPARVEVFLVDTGDRLLTSAGPLDDPFGSNFAFARGRREAACVVGADRIVRSGPDGKALGERTFPGSVIRIAYDHGGRRLAAIGRGKNFVRVYDLANETFVDHDFTAQLPGEANATLSAVALSADGERLAVGTWRGTVLVRELRGQPAAATTATIAAHAGTVWSLAFDHLDPGLLLSSGGSQGIACWDLDSGECCYQTVRDVATHVQVSDDGRTLACLVPDGVLLLDLSYRRRHIAGTLADQLARLRSEVVMPRGREAELRAWADAVLAEPWPRWR